MSEFISQVLSGTHRGTPVKDLGLRGRGVVHIHDTQLIQVISRSSRVLRRDAERLLDILSAARAHTGVDLHGRLIVLNAPICSKARAWLETNGVHVDTGP